MIRSSERKRLELILEGYIMLEKSYKNRIHRLIRNFKSQFEQLAQQEEKIYQLQKTIKCKDEQITEQCEEIQHLKRELRFTYERISDLECLQDPYSPDGDPVCNSFRHEWISDLECLQDAYSSDDDPIFNSEF
ncbi:MAG TPA: hypothetical protein VK203_03320 [Nostocaceae cyanobacterium]|nr:hypothetical protein [Nostocaceae cyanobacterium]